MIRDYKGKVTRIFNGKISHESIHPEIGEFREKFLYKDLKVFKEYNISNFLRPLYKNELDLYEEQIINDSCKGEECVAMNCFRVDSETRAAIPLNIEMFKHCAMNEKTPIYYQKQLLINSNTLKAIKKNTKKGFKNES